MICPLLKIYYSFSFIWGMKVSSRKYSDLRIMLEQGEIKNFEQLADLLPCTKLARDIHISPTRMKKLLYGNIGDIRFGEMIRLSNILGIDYQVLGVLVVDQIKRSPR
jgi:hypothetical protein